MRIQIIVIMTLVPSLVFGTSAKGYYGGVTVTKRHFDFKSGFGDSMFAKSLNQIGILGGLDLNRWLGVELEAFSSVNNKPLTIMIPFGRTELGVESFSGLGSDTYLSKVKLLGSSLQLTARHSIIRNLNMFVAAGVSVVKMQLRTDMLLNDNLPATFLEKKDNRINESTTKALALLGSGVDLHLARHFGIRAEVAWENTSKLNMKFQTPAAKPNSYKLKPNNSLVYGLTIYLSQ